VQKAKVVFAVLLLFVLVRYADVYHRATDFNNYVQEEVSMIHSKGSLKEVLLMKAEQNRLPITDQNINFTTSGTELRVSIEYQAPLDLILFQKSLTFHSTGVCID
jgi:hypothetical protein